MCANPGHKTAAPDRFEHLRIRHIASRLAAANPACGAYHNPRERPLNVPLELPGCLPRAHLGEGRTLWLPFAKRHIMMLVSHVMHTRATRVFGLWGWLPSPPV